MHPTESKSNEASADFSLSWEQLCPEELMHLDSVCDQFEKAYLQSPNVRIEDFVATLSNEHRILVATELIEVEWSIRQTRGENPVATEYAGRFPECESAIRQIAQTCFSACERRSPSNVTTSMADELQNTLRSSTHFTTVPSITGAASDADAPPRKISLGHFEIQQEIGRGGMGVVYRAKDTHLDRDVALKSLIPDAYRQPHARERFLREAKAAAVVRHPNIVTIYSVEVFDGAPLIAMELVDGVTLETYLKKHGRMSALEVAKLGRQLASGLAAAHQRGLVHRDVKPANILLEISDNKTEGGSGPQVHCAKLTDFGIARAASDLSLTHPDIIAGTPQFMSPEQANGEPIDHRSDLFSLGGVLYAASLGKSAFVAETIPELMYKVVHTSAEPLKRICPGFDSSLSDLIERLMERRPERRIQTAEETAKQFDEIASRLSQPSNGSSNGKQSPASLRMSGRPSIKWLIAACFFLFMLSGLFFLRTGSGEFILETDDPNIAVMLGPDKGIVVEDGHTKMRYTLKQGINRLPTGNYDLQVTTPDGLQIDTPKFALTRNGKSYATVTAKGPSAEVPQAEVNALKHSPLFNPHYCWSTPINLGVRINTEADESHPTISGDGLTLVFLRDSKAYQASRYQVGRTFRVPTLLPGPLNEEGDVDSPCLSRDGLTLVFASARQGSLGANDLWICKRATVDAPFSKPENLGPMVNTSEEDSTPSLSADSLTLWFCSLRHDESQQVDLYEASRPSTDAPFSQAKRLAGSINGPGNDFFPRPAFSDRVMFFTVTHEGEQHLYYARRQNLNVPFGKPRPFVFVSDTGLVGTVAVSEDGQMMVYDSNQATGKGGFDLWLVRSMNVKDPKIKDLQD